VYIIYLNSVNKHQQRTAATEQRLLRAARRIFARDGFEAAKIDEIATAAGYTRGAFYAHFKSKEELFFALLEQQSTVHVEALLKRMQDAKSEEERMARLREYYVERANDSQWSVLMIEFKLYALRHPRLRARLAERHRTIRMRIKQAAGLEQLNPFQSERSRESMDMARILLEVVLQGLVLESEYDPGNITPERMKFALGRLFDLVAMQDPF
jgi:AcrR family transcriptional regulator